MSAKTRSQNRNKYIHVQSDHCLAVYDQYCDLTAFLDFLSFKRIFPLSKCFPPLPSPFSLCKYFFSLSFSSSLQKTEYFSLSKYILPFLSSIIVLNFFLQKCSFFSSVFFLSADKLFFPVPNIFRLFFSSSDQIFSKKQKAHSFLCLFQF